MGHSPTPHMARTAHPTPARACDFLVAADHFSRRGRQLRVALVLRELRRRGKLHPPPGRQPTAEQQERPADTPRGRTSPTFPRRRAAPNLTLQAFFLLADHVVEKLLEPLHAPLVELETQKKQSSRMPVAWRLGFRKRSTILKATSRDSTRARCEDGWGGESARARTRPHSLP